MANKVTIQVPSGASQALSPLPPLALWTIDSQSSMLTMTQPSGWDLVRGIGWQVGVAVVAALWAGFFIGSSDARRKLAQADISPLVHVFE